MGQEKSRSIKTAGQSGAFLVKDRIAGQLGHVCMRWLFRDVATEERGTAIWLGHSVGSPIAQLRMSVRIYAGAS